MGSGVPLPGAVAIVTGASSGIGAATAEALAAAGARTWLVGRDPERLAAVAARTGGTAVEADLGRPGEPARVAAAVLEAAGRVDVLVNNAGSGWAGGFDRMDAATVERLVAVNLTAPLLLTRAVLPAMLAAGRGAVVLVASIAGVVGVAEEAAYAATKAGLIGFADSLRPEVAGRGVAVTLVVPGVVDTPFFARRGRPYDRRRPRPVPASAVATGLVDGVQRGAAEVYVPRWLVVPARLRGATPALYRRLAARFG